MEAPRRRARICRHEMPLDLLGLPGVFTAFAPAALALVAHALFQVVPVEYDVGPTKGLIMPALRARYVPFLPRRLLKLRLDAAASLDGRCRYDNGLLVPKGRLALLRQEQRVALCSGAGRVAVHLVAQQHLDRSAGKARRAVRADDRHVSARKVLLQDRVAGIAALGVYQHPQHRRIPYHGSQEVLAERLAHFEGRLHHQHRRGIVVHIVAEHIHQHGRLADLRGGHDHDLAHVLVADGVHDLPLIRRVVRMPPARRGAVLRTQHPVGVRPLR